LEKLKIEKQLIGFYFSGHPMDEYRALWVKSVKVVLGHPETIESGNYILVGIIKAIRTANSKSGKMAYITIADYNGEIEMVFFSRVWEIWQSRIQEGQIAIVKGKIDYQEDRDKYSFIADGLIDSLEVETVIAEEDALQRKREKFRSAWLYMADLKSGSIAGAEKGSYTVIGQLTALRKTQDRNGNEMAFGTLHDFEGDIDLVFFSKIWAECRDLISLDEFIALKGSVDPSTDRNPQKPSLKVSSIADLAALSRSAERKAAAGEEPSVPALETQAVKNENPANTEQPVPLLNEIHILLQDGAADRDENIQPLRNYLLGNSGPCPVYIHIEEKIIRANKGLSLEAEKEALGVLEGCIGVARAWKEQCK
jgi:DNA polymerase-3 subunit alpha